MKTNPEPKYAKWKHTDPYPTWPFTRVKPSEMQKYLAKNQKQEDAKW